jgi:hypothetical protein
MYITACSKQCEETQFFDSIQPNSICIDHRQSTENETTTIDPQRKKRLFHRGIEMTVLCIIFPSCALKQNTHFFPSDNTTQHHIAIKLFKRSWRPG